MNRNCGSGAGAPVTAQAVVGDALQRRTREFLFLPPVDSVYRHSERSARMARRAIGG